MNAAGLIGYFESQRNDFTKILEKLVSFQTYSGDVKGINCFLDYLEEIFSEFNPKISRINTNKGDILHLSLFTENKSFLVFLAHADTVKVADFPIPIRIDDGKFYGNGCYDMKSAIALFYFAIRAIKNFKLKCDKEIKLIFTPDEETGSDFSKPFLKRECRDAKAVILPEPCCDNGGVKIKRKGIVWLKIKFTGEASHSGTEPEKGKNANVALVKLITRVYEMLEEYPDVSFNPGIIYGGVATNVISPVSFLEGELRGYSNASLKNMIEDMKKIKSIDGIMIDFSSQFKQPALEFTEANKNLYEKAKKIAGQLNYNLPCCLSGGGSDGATLSFEGIPVIDGIGIKGGGAHSTDEYIELSDFPFRAALITGLYEEIDYD